MVPILKQHFILRPTLILSYHLPTMKRFCGLLCLELSTETFIYFILAHEGEINMNSIKCQRFRDKMCTTLCTDMLKTDKLCTALYADMLRRDSLYTSLCADMLKTDKLCTTLYADMLRTDKLCTTLYADMLRTDKFALHYMPAC